MIKIIINDNIYTCKTDSEAQQLIEKEKNNHISHPYFYLLPKIKEIKSKIWNDTAKVTDSTINSWYRKLGKLESERKTYLFNNNINMPNLSIKIESFN